MTWFNPRTAQTPSPNVRDFGAVGDGVVDDTVAVQAAISFVAGGELYFPPGTYKLTQVASAQAFAQPRIKGAGMHKTTILTTANQAAIKLVGGSGTRNGGGISDMTFSGTGYGIELNGACGITIENVKFLDTLAEGLRFHNSTSGAFTEMSVARDCEFICRRAIHYMRGSGTDSFHGTGFQNCSFSPPNSGSEPVILIDDNCNIYNAPWDGHFLQPSSTVSPIKSLTDANYTPRTFGTLRFEGDGTPFFLVDPVSTTPIFHAGSVMCLGKAFKLGTTFQLCTRIATYIDGSHDHIRLPYEQQFIATTGTTNISDALDSGNYLIQVDVQGVNYSYNYLLAVHRSSFGATGTVTTLANGEAINTAGWGAPTFDVSSSKLRITNAHASFNVTVRIRVTEMFTGISAFQ